jgi:DNA polymerase III subunit delta
MKLGAAEARRTYARADPARAGLLIYGADPMRVALMREEVIRLVAGPEAEADMRVTRLAGSDLRQDPARLLDAIKAQGFFPGPRVAFLEEAGDGVEPVVNAALADWRPGDAMLVVTAGDLKGKSALRKLFEGHRAAHALGLYDDPPTRDEVARLVAEAGLAEPGREAMSDLLSLSQALDPGDFRQTLLKLALYKRDDPAPLTPADIAICAPATVEAEVEEVVFAAAEGRVAEIGGLIRRLAGQGEGAVGICIAATRHFRALHAAAADPGGAAAGLARARPPVYGPKRDRMQRQATVMGRDRLETALRLLVETDLTLRSTSNAPALALVERALIRLAMLVPT